MESTISGNGAEPRQRTTPQEKEKRVPEGMWGGMKASYFPAWRNTKRRTEREAASPERGLVSSTGGTVAPGKRNTRRAHDAPPGSLPDAEAPRAPDLRQQRQACANGLAQGITDSGVNPSVGTTSGEA